MASLQRVGDLELPQDMAFQEREWIAQRIGWTAMLVISIVALTGLLGAGPLSQATAGDDRRSFQVTFPRFAHVETPAELTIQLQAGAATSNEARIWLSRAYLQDNEVRQIVPPPHHVEAGADRLTFVFQLSDPAQESAFTFFIEPQQIGANAGEAGIDGGATVRFRQFVYP